MKREMIVPTRIEIELGQAMTAIPERWRVFCISYMSNGGNGSEAARMAGYSDESNACRVRASELIRNPRIQAAMKELGDAAFVEMVPGALKAIKDIATNPQHTKQMDAAKYTLQQAGYREVREVNHNISVSDKEKIERIRALATRMGKDPREFLGENAIDVEFEDVDDEGPVVVNGEEY